MRNIFSIIILFILITLFAQKNDKLYSGFKKTPDSIQTSVYWYWISDNVSKNGVIRDLQAMKRAGINRAFIGNIGLNDVPYGNVKMLSKEWWDILHTALKTATELNIEIGIFNSPGWSQSGGPWIRAEDAMKYLATSELIVKGPLKLHHKFECQIDLFQDVRVIAYPKPKDYQITLNDKNGIISSIPTVSNFSNVFDGDKNTGIVLPAGNELIINMEAKSPFTARSLTVFSTEIPMLATIILQVKFRDGDYRTISEFEMNRYNPALNVGFIPYAPLVISFPATTAQSFRLIVKNATLNSGLAEIVLASYPRVERYSEKTLSKMHPTPLPYWKEYQWIPQCEVDDKSTVIDALKVLDITKYFEADGTLNWDVPLGEWIILRTGMVPTGVVNSQASPESTGYEVDKMSKSKIEKHFNAYIGEILKRIPEDDRKTFKIVVADSYETGSQNFTETFLDEFKKKYGYDPIPYIPVYFGNVVNSQLESDRFLWDMRRMVADKVAYDYVGGLRDVCHKNGLTLWLENYGHWGFPSEFLMYGGQSDEISGEFWSEGELGDIENRAATSCGHIYGKNKISAESNTCVGAPFSRYPGTIKKRGDRFFAEGVNNTLLHVYITQPYEDKNPGMNAWFGSEFNRKNTWFSQIDLYTQYLKRINYMLQQGLNVADVAYFIGEDAPKMTGITDPDLPVGYQFDYINAEVIEKHMTVKNNLITLPHGTQYRILVLPKLETMRPELLTKIKQLVNEGAVILGPAPMRSPSLHNQPRADQQIKVMATELWGNVDGVNVKYRIFGKGMVMNGLTLKEALVMINCYPDCRLPEDNQIHYGHRTAKEGEIYFISNQTDETKIINPEFRVKEKQPELWEATTGYYRNLPAYILKENNVEVPIKLEPYESVFVVFRNNSQKSTMSGLEANYPVSKVLVEVGGPWTVYFDSQQRGHKKPIVFEYLQDWSKSQDDKIRYYSGTAFYCTSFKIAKFLKSEKIVIDLGAFTAMAKVSINGKYVGGLWTPPYQLDISNFVKLGQNNLKIEVVNTWVNRLIGNRQLPENQRQAWCPINPYTKESPLQSSGLLGPVKILTLKY